VFLQDTPWQLTDLRDLVQNGDSVRLVEAAHTLNLPKRIRHKQHGDNANHPAMVGHTT
jgi:aryl carrier-like protein